jgi:5-methylcytosine-specific restriction endonuclease McrA
VARERSTICDFCRSEFTTAKSLQRYCSEWCSDLAQNQPGTFPMRVGRICPYCGTGLSVRERVNRRFCSAECQAKHNQGARRARRRGLPAEDIDRQEIFKRDGWRCHLCHEQIDPGLRGRHPMSASLDHVIPLSWPDSPGHVSSNVAAAHLRCNIRKGAGSLVGR